MIFVNRINQPKILADNSSSWTTDYLIAKSVFSTNPTDDNKKNVSNIEKRYNHKDVKDRLKLMFHKKCAFCEATVTHVSYGEIEHFKPKSLYPDLCFEWNNFLLSCSVCNGKGNKGDKFPLVAEGGPFINPTEENPDDFFVFDYDNLLNKFIVFPKNVRGKTMLSIIKLNREDLVEHRTNSLIKIINFIEKIIQKDADKLDVFINEFSEKDEYYAFIKTIFIKVKNNI